jgi:hypothetical protein
LSIANKSFREGENVMKRKLAVFLVAFVVAMGLLLGASTTQAQGISPALLFLLDSDAEASFPVTTSSGGSSGGGGGGGGCFIDTAVGFFHSIYFMLGEDYGGRVGELWAQRGKSPVGWGKGRIYSSHGDCSQ